MTVSKIYLVTRNARDKVQVVIAELEQNGNSFTIKRTTGQYQGKMTNQPDLVIERGKAKRSVLQQAELEYNSIVKKYQDKGYKRLDSLTNKAFDLITPAEMDNLAPTLRSDQDGNLKPMLAKSSTQCQNSVLDKKMWNSRKLNGVRMMTKYSPDLDKVITISRGGKNYDEAAKLITDELYEYLKANPDIILDGELYHHGTYLQTISGMARLKEWEPRCSILEYWVYDLAIPDVIFDDRLKILDDLRLDTFKDSKKIKIQEHYPSQSWEEIQRLHDKWVKEGFEGLVARKPNKVYEYGKRSSTMIKVKQRNDEEFEIVDYKDGLRDEDFCFILQTKEGKLFSAKPNGSRDIKEAYMNRIDYMIGKMATVSYFEWSSDKIPQQPVFIGLREDLI
jgi:ATP-dependent DNA ligase